ncbi:MAG: hypothetical protein ACYC9Z_15845 [Casimicrobiaceae bacterium]
MAHMLDRMIFVRCRRLLRAAVTVAVLLATQFVFAAQVCHPVVDESMQNTQPPPLAAHGTDITNAGGHAAACCRDDTMPAWHSSEDKVYVAPTTLGVLAPFPQAVPHRGGPSMGVAITALVRTGAFVSSAAGRLPI